MILFDDKQTHIYFSYCCLDFGTSDYCNFLPIRPDRGKKVLWQMINVNSIINYNEHQYLIFEKKKGLTILGFWKDNPQSI